MKKILFISHWFPNSQNPNEGIFIRNHAELIAERFNLTVVHFNFKHSDKIYKKDIFIDKNRTYHFIQINISSRFYKFLIYCIPFHYFLFRRLKLARFDLVHSNVIFPNGVVGYLISKRQRIPQVHSEHWSKFNHFLRTNPWNFLGKKSIQNMRFILPVSSFLAKEIVGNVHETKIQVIPNYVPDFFQCSKQLGAQFHIVAITNFNKPKNPFLFLDSLQRICLKADKPAFSVSLIGDIRESSISEKNYSFPIQLKGQMTPLEINSFLKSAHLFVHGSDYETFSIVILEALKTGTPVVCSNVGIASEVINSTNGFVCNSALDWDECLTSAMSQNYNYAKIADDIHSKYSKQHILELIASVYEKCSI